MAGLTGWSKWVGLIDVGVDWAFLDTGVGFLVNVGRIAGEALLRGDAELAGLWAWYTGVCGVVEEETASADEADVGDGVASVAVGDFAVLGLEPGVDNGFVTDSVGTLSGWSVFCTEVILGDVNCLDWSWMIY